LGWNTSTVAELLTAAKTYSNIQISEQGNSWLPHSFVGVTTFDGNKFAIYFRDTELRFLSANAGSIRDPVVVLENCEGLEGGMLLSVLSDFQDGYFGSLSGEVPSFVAAVPNARKTSEIQSQLFSNWVMPLISGALIVLLASLISIFSSAAPELSRMGDTSLNPAIPKVAEKGLPSAPDMETQTITPITPLEGGALEHFPGSAVMCGDGTMSNSGGKQGACSWHGGVR